MDGSESDFLFCKQSEEESDFVTWQKKLEMTSACDLATDSHDIDTDASGASLHILIRQIMNLPSVRRVVGFLITFLVGLGT